jgi:hypothetical protein
VSVVLAANCMGFVVPLAVSFLAILFRGESRGSVRLLDIAGGPVVVNLFQRPGRAVRIRQRPPPGLSPFRNACLSTFPSAVVGRASRRWTDFGACTGPFSSRTCAVSSLGVAMAPGRSTTAAVTASPHFSSGSPNTAAIATASWLVRASSISREKTLKPPLMIMSLIRSTIVR